MGLQWGYDLLQQRKEVTLRSDAEERVHVRHDRRRSSWLMLSGGCTGLYCILYIFYINCGWSSSMIKKIRSKKASVYCNDFGGDCWSVASEILFEIQCWAPARYEWSWMALQCSGIGCSPICEWEEPALHASHHSSELPFHFWYQKAPSLDCQTIWSETSWMTLTESRSLVRKLLGLRNTWKIRRCTNPQN